MRRLAILLCLVALPALADTQRLGMFQSWGAFSNKDSGALVCYASSKPVKSEGTVKKRNPVLAEVTDRPSEHHNGVIDILAGYTMDAAKPVTLEIGKQSFKLFAHADAAFAQNADDAKIVAAMRTGQSMVFSATTGKGVVTKDTFTLAGMPDALREIDKACSVTGGAKVKK
jgi:hypothetical protein